MPFIENPTKTTQTIVRYNKIVSTLWAQYLKFSSGDTTLALTPESLSIHQDRFLAWLSTNKRPELQSNSWRLYGSALFYVFSEYGFVHLASAIQNLSLEQSPQKKSNNTSAQKARSFTPENFDKLLEALATKSESKYAFPLFCWLNCGLIFGLRPSEWATASFEVVEAEELGFKADEVYNVAVILHIDNAKFTNGRGHGRHRQIHALLSEEQYSYLYSFIEYLEQFPFDHLYHECRNLLYQLNRRIFSKNQKNITLYSLRHQWNANQKAHFIKQNTQVKDSLEKLAAMNGHASLRTATRHYGRARGGWGSPVAPVKPSQTSVEQVRAKQRGQTPSLLKPSGISRDNSPACRLKTE